MVINIIYATFSLGVGMEDLLTMISTLLILKDSTYMKMASMQMVMSKTHLEVDPNH